MPVNIPSLRDNPIFYLGLAVTIEQGVGQGTIALVDVIPAVAIPYVKAWCTLLAFIGTAIMTALAAPSMTKPPTEAIAKMLAWLVMPLVLVLLMGGSAMAQTKRPPLTGDPVKDAQQAGQRLFGQPQGSNEGGGVSGLGAGAQSLLDKPFQDLANFIGDDIDAAITLSTTIPTLQDGNGQQCLMALKTFGDVVKAHPAPLTFKIASDLEAFRLKQMAVNQLCENTACTVVFADITQTITALSPVPLPIPSLHDLCSKVPTIKVVAPATPATPAARQP